MKKNEGGLLAPWGSIHGAPSFGTEHKFEVAPAAYLLLCLFLRNLFLRLWVAILCPFFFFPFGIVFKNLWLFIECYSCL